MSDEYYPSTKKEAKGLGYTYYYTDKPCKYGHVDVRFTSNGRCYSCVKESSKQYHVENREHKNEQVRQWHEANREYVNEQRRQWREQNLERDKEKRRQHYEFNKEHEKELTRQWRIRNPEKVHFYSAKRKADKLQATPKWVDNELIELIYTECPESYQVDHIIPLQGDMVCGLHIPENMQYLTESENKSKDNKFDPSDPEYFVYEDRYCLDIVYMQQDKELVIG